MKLEHLLVVVWMTIVGAVARAQTELPANPVSAIDVLFEPDATMVAHAEAANARLRESYPQGFALDATHRPHITTLQRFVRTVDLPKIYEAVGKVLKGKKPAAWKLKAYKYYYLPWDGNGLAGIVIKPTEELIQFQRKVVDAVAPYTVATGTAAAFVTTEEDPSVGRPTIDYIAAYVPEQVGREFNPHVTIGLANEIYLRRMLEEKFAEFTFSVEGLAVYHLGNNGTARKKLHEWKFGTAAGTRR